MAPTWKQVHIAAIITALVVVTPAFAFTHQTRVSVNPLTIPTNRPKAGGIHLSTEPRRERRARLRGEYGRVPDAHIPEPNEMWAPPNKTIPFGSAHDYHVTGGTITRRQSGGGTPDGRPGFPGEGVYGPLVEVPGCFYCPPLDLREPNLEGRELLKELTTEKMMTFMRARKPQLKNKCVFYTQAVFKPPEWLSDEVSVWSCAHNKLSIWVSPGASSIFFYIFFFVSVT